MTEPILTCPTCRTEIKLTESLAAPLIADTRRRCETQLAQKEAEVAGREAAKAGELPQDFQVRGSRRLHPVVAAGSDPSLEGKAGHLSDHEVQACPLRQHLALTRIGTFRTSASNQIGTPGHRWPVVVRIVSRGGQGATGAPIAVTDSQSDFSMRTSGSDEHVKPA
jgi:hypothetical protein